MKKCIVIFVGLVMFCFPNNSWSVTKSGPQLLDNWEETVEYGNSTSTPDGTTLSFDIRGVTSVYREASFVGATGVLATINVSKSSDGLFFNLLMDLGTDASGNVINAGISTMRYQGNRILYTLKSYNIITDVSTDIIVGSMATSGNGWTEDQDITLGLARIGNEIWFYSSELNYMIKVLSLDILGPADDPVVTIGAISEFPQGQSAAVVRDVYIIYP